MSSMDNHRKRSHRSERARRSAFGAARSPRITPAAVKRPRFNLAKLLQLVRINNRIRANRKPRPAAEQTDGNVVTE